jgi:hypothetical protein
MHEVVCAVCGRQSSVSAGATATCPSCGAPLSVPPVASSVDDDSATRPSIPPTPIAAVEDETTRVAMPAGAVSADPASAQEAAAGAPDSPEASDVTADLPQPPSPERTATIPAPAMPETESQTRPVVPVDAPAMWPSAPNAPVASADAPSVGTPSVQPAPATSRRSPFAVLGVVLLIILLLALIAAGILFANGRLPFFGATATPTVAATATPDPTPTAPISLTPFTDADHVFRVGYPSSWLVATRNVSGTEQRLVLFTNSSAAATFEIGTLSTTDVLPAQIDDQALSLLGEKTGIANPSGPTPVFFAGESWTQKSGDVTLLVNNQQMAMHAKVLAIIHGNHTVFILTLAPANTFPAIDPFFELMQQSFEFL